MATTSSIGTSSRNYSTIASWLAAFASGGWIGECYNDSEFVITSAITGSGLSTSSTDFIRLTTATGQSAFDNAANPLKYDATKGVAIRCTNNYVAAISPNVDYFELLKLQVQHSGGGRAYDNSIGGAHVGKNATKCLFESVGNGSNTEPGIRSGLHINNVYVRNGTGSNGIITAYSVAGTKLLNCTLVRPSDKTASGTAFALESNIEVTNCAAFGFSTFSSGVTTGTNNATDLASIGFGSGHQTSLTYTSQFNGTTAAAQDWAAKSGNGLQHGTTGGSIPTVDIFNTTRAATPTIGAHEFVSGGGGSVFNPYFYLQHIARMAA